MSDLKIELKDKKRIMQVFKDAPKEMAQAIQDALEQTGGYAMGKTMQQAPVKTHMLRTNISLTEVTPLKVVVSPNYTVTPYAKHVIQGTGIYAGKSRFKGKIPGVGWRWINGQKPNPFIDRTIQQDGKSIIDFFNRTLAKFTERLAQKIGK